MKKIIKFIAIPSISSGVALIICFAVLRKSLNISISLTAIVLIYLINPVCNINKNYAFNLSDN